MIIDALLAPATITGYNLIVVILLSFLEGILVKWWFI